MHSVVIKSIMVSVVMPNVVAPQNALAYFATAVSYARKLFMKSTPDWTCSIAT
jgi:hypothetical protein